MGILNFEHLPVSTLVGADTATFDSVVAGLSSSDLYRGKMLTTRCLQRMLSPLYELNKRSYGRLPNSLALASPLFIIGHWRSGTTFVHNLLSQDDRFGYCTTFQTIFPHLMLQGCRSLRYIVQLFIPSSRATDGMPLSVDTPQEEEVALSNMTHLSFYHVLSSPRRIAYWRERALLMNGLEGGDSSAWRCALRHIVATALHVQRKEMFLSKNPPHTARIEQILKIWPDAKFIYLVRNPYIVFQSTRNFFGRTIHSTTLEPFDESALDEEILLTYKLLLERYERDKVLIRSGNLVELRFEDLETDPITVCESIYKALSLGDFERVRGRMEQYLAMLGTHRRSSYSYDQRCEELVERWCGDTLRRWDYTLPQSSKS